MPVDKAFYPFHSFASCARSVLFSLKNNNYDSVKFNFIHVMKVFFIKAQSLRDDT